MNTKTSSVSLIGTLSMFGLGLLGCSKRAKVEVDTTQASASAVVPAAPAATTAAAVKATAGGGSCTHGDKSMCIDYVGLSSMEAGEEKADCEKESGKWASSPCVATNLLGTCSNPAGGTTTIKLYKGADFTSAAEAKKGMCSDKGDTWVATK